MPELRRAYNAVPHVGGATNVSPLWATGQGGRTVSPTVPFNWNQYKAHLTVDSGGDWDTSGQVKRIRKFHLSFKEWKGQSLAGPTQPGCTWTWSAAQSKYVFTGWFNVPYLYLKPGENVTIRNKVNDFMLRHAELLVLDKQMWAAIGDATVP